VKVAAESPRARIVDSNDSKILWLDKSCVGHVCNGNTSAADVYKLVDRCVHFVLGMGDTRVTDIVATRVARVAGRGEAVGAGERERGHAA
jgi:hypothetical protein